jgi:hypothetical protein
MTMEYIQNPATDVDKLKHELIGSLGIIRMLTNVLMQGSIDMDKTKNFLQLINSLAERNMQIINEFNNA